MSRKISKERQSKKKSEKTEKSNNKDETEEGNYSNGYYGELKPRNKVQPID